ncbi:MAG: hypothetical protein ACRCWC_11405 [Plesiomonas shigelloides]
MIIKWQLSINGNNTEVETRFIDVLTWERHTKRSMQQLTTDLRATDMVLLTWYALQRTKHDYANLSLADYEAALDGPPTPVDSGPVNPTVAATAAD